MAYNKLSTAPYLPIELLERIIQEAWALPLSTHDRAKLMKTSLNVNSTWLNIFLPIACRDVHIPSVEYALLFYQILSGQSDLYNTFAEGMTDRLCRSITFHGTNDLTHPPELVLGDHPTAVAMTVALFVPHISPERLSHLRRISVIYTNCPLNDIFGRRKHFEFPSQVTDLEVLISWDSDAPSCVVDAFLSSEEPTNIGPGSAPSIMTLRVHGASKGMMVDLKLACPNATIESS